MLVKDQIIEGNKSIALFMEGKLKKDCLPMTAKSMNDNEMWLPFHGIKSINKLKYDSSWDWLIPVVYKISRMTDDPEIKIRFKILIENFINTLILDIAFAGVVQFIKWYNQYQK